MTKADVIDAATDKELAKLETRIIELFGEAERDISREIADYFEKFKKRDAEMKKLLDKGEITANHYKQWRLNQIGRGKRLEAMANKVAERLYNADVEAAGYINDDIPMIYSINRNWAAYSVDVISNGAYTSEHGEKLGFDFTLWDEHTVRRMIRDAPDLMPNYPEARAVKRGIDLAFGKDQIRKRITASIISGDSLKKMADKLSQSVPTMSRVSAIRACRTAYTAAQNGGRQDAYDDAAKMGIEVRKRWDATKDFRTRPAHQDADGQVVPYNQPFIVGDEPLMFPGDSHGSAANIYNCRCTMRTVEKENIEAEPRMMRVRNADGINVLVPKMTYKQWEKWVRNG